MPNAKLYVDQSVWEIQHADFKQSLSKIREVLCQYLNVPPAACQLALIPVSGLLDQPVVNIELHIMPHPDRTKDLLLTLSGKLQEIVGSFVKGGCAVRVATLDPMTYVALK